MNKQLLLKEGKAIHLYRNDEYFNILNDYPNLRTKVSSSLSDEFGSTIYILYGKDGRVNPNKGLILPHTLFSIRSGAIKQAFNDVINVVARAVLVNTVPTDWNNAIIGYNGIGLHFDRLGKDDIKIVRSSLIGLGGNSPEWLGIAETCNEQLVSPKKVTKLERKSKRNSSDKKQSVSWLGDQFRPNRPHHNFARTPTTSAAVTVQNIPLSRDDTDLVEVPNRSYNIPEGLSNSELEDILIYESGVRGDNPTGGSIFERALIPHMERYIRNLMEDDMAETEAAEEGEEGEEPF